MRRLRSYDKSKVKKTGRNKRPVTTFTWWVDERTLKGSANPTDEDLAELRAQGFATAVSLLEEEKQPLRYDRQAALSEGWTIYSIPIPENQAPSIEQIHEFIARLNAAPNGAKILVFCQSGKGRTACMGAAYWIAQGLTTSAAIERMSKRCLDNEWPTPERRHVLGEYERMERRR
jgi:protein-tyrosine phosphatase